jgi:hypothetical protein
MNGDLVAQNERGLLGSILRDNSNWSHTAELASTDFSLSNHTVIYGCMAAMFYDGKTVDTFSLSQELDRMGKLESVGLGYLSTLRIEGDGVHDVTGLVRDIKEASAKKQWKIQYELLGKATSHQTQGECLSVLRDLHNGTASQGLKSKGLLLTPSQLKQREIESGATKQLVEGLLPMHGANVAVGDSNIGKSPLVVQLAVCVAAGKPFLGFETQHGKVVFVDYENTGMLAGMIEQTTRAVGADPRVVEENLTILTRDDVPPLDGLIALTKDAVLVVVDSFRFLTNGHDTDGKVIMPILRKIGQQNCWLLVHHIRKEGAQKAEDKVEPLVKAESVVRWLECASGHRSIINQTTNRWAIDDHDIRTDLLLRVSAKGRAEGAPMHLSRIFEGEEPIGYERSRGSDFLTERQKEQFKQLLGMTLSFDEMARILGTDQKPNKSSASRLLKACQANELVSTTIDGKYRFVETAPVW